MLKQFGDFIESHHLIPARKKVLLAVSGGADSVVMAHLFAGKNIPAAIAHCNFQLRGEESDADERFVRNLGKQLQMPVHVERFNTLAEVDKRGGSIQMVARDLRFEWFEELMETGNYAVVAAAHHFDDQIETFFINLFRGTGISGLRSIVPQQGNVIHPMLFASRKQIEAFATSENIDYRTDTSNTSLKYQRNRIRHQLMPLIADLAPDYSEAFRKNFELLRGTEKMLQDYAGQMESKLTYIREDHILIDKAGLTETATGEEWLSLYLSRFGFHIATAKKVWQALEATPGKIFNSGSHRLLNDRAYLILEALIEKEDEQLYITKETRELKKPLVMKFQKQPLTSEIVIESDKNIAMLDYEKLEFPLQLRRWKQGDVFYPLGMKKKKKLSDFFIDNKLSLLDKEKVWLLTSANEIVWIAGQRIDHRFRITEKTRQIYHVELFKE